MALNSIPDELCVPFVLFLTKLSGVALLARLLAQRRVAVMLDLDATLLESEHIMVRQEGWGANSNRNLTTPPACHSRPLTLCLFTPNVQEQPMSWSFHEWRRIGLTSLPSGMAVAGFVARLPAEPHRAQVYSDHPNLGHAASSSHERSC